MRMTLALLAATTALTAAVGLPALSAVCALPLTEDARSEVADESPELRFLLASNDEEDEDDDDDEEGDDDDDECDGTQVCRRSSNPAPSGSVPPPQNGLFGNGAPPTAQVN